jgi:DNA-directed RNA polymerase specialized sigma24 family protein
MTRRFFDTYDPARARFRTFVRTCVDHFAANARRAESRLKRGGGALVLPLDFDGAEAEFARAGSLTEADAESCFYQEWVRAVLSRAVESFREECARDGHEDRFRLFERYDLQPTEGRTRPTYKELAGEFALPVTQVTNHLAWARRAFRRQVFGALRALSGSEAEFRAEARELLGTDPP